MKAAGRRRRSVTPPVAAHDSGGPSLARALDGADRLLALVARGADIEEITSTVSAALEAPVVVLDRGLRRIAAHPDDAGLDLTEDGDARAALQQIAAEGRPASVPGLSGRSDGSASVTMIAPITADGELLGYLAALADVGAADDATALLSMQHAATVLALTLLRERISAHLTNDVRVELVRGLLLGSSDDAEHRERMGVLQLDPKRTYRAIILVAERTSPQGRATRVPSVRTRELRSVLDAILHYLETAAVDAVAVATAEEVIAFQPEPGFDAPGGPTGAELARSVIHRMRSLFPDVAVTAGIGGPTREPREFPRSYREARNAIEVSQRSGRTGQASVFEELGVYSLLLRVQDWDQLRAFAARVLGPLDDYDRVHRSQLVRTLEVQLRHYGRPQAAAQQLHCHVNTVGYRLERIRAIADLDVDDAEDRLVAALALKIRDLLPPRE